MGKNVLFFVDNMEPGGIQKLAYDLSLVIDRSKIKLEFLLLDDGNEYDMEHLIEENGDKVHKLNNIWVRKPQDFITYRKAIRDFFEKHHDYAAVHMNSGPKNYYVLACAKEYGIPVRIAHSHSSDYATPSLPKKIVGIWCKVLLKKSANVYIACSEPAADWMFGERFRKSGKVIKLINGVDVERFAYNVQIRNRVRDELEVNDALVIGNVGRFSVPKNNIRLIEIFSEIHKRNSNTVLVLAGVGELMDQAKLRAEELGILGNIKFLGFRTDVFELLQAMDVYIMPSLYEGFPVTGVEAQVSGLPCIFSDAITREACLLDSTQYLSLDESDKVWAEAALSLANSADREASKEVLKKQGFDIKDMAQKLMAIYNI